MKLWQHIAFGFMLGFLIPGFLVEVMDIVVNVSFEYRFTLGLLGILGQMAPNVFEHMCRDETHQHTHSFWHSWALFAIFGLTTFVFYVWLAPTAITFIVAYMSHIILDYIGVSDGIPGIGPFSNPLQFKKKG